MIEVLIHKCFSKSNSPSDLVLFYKKMVKDNLDCVFGSRFIKGGKTVDYPPLKKLINRIANLIIRILIGISYNDTTNAFKLYKRETIEGIKPIISPHFNLTIELPLKAIIRGFSYGVVPNSWINRQHGVSKLKIREMGSRYFFILMYCFFEKYFSKGDIFYSLKPIVNSSGMSLKKNIVTFRFGVVSC